MGKDKIKCSLFGEFCTSEKNRKKCENKFYKCSKINNKEYYGECLDFFINHFINNQEDIVNDGTKRHDFEKIKNSPDRMQCNPRLLNREPMKNDGITINDDEDFICKCYYLCSNGKCSYSNDECNRHFIPQGEYKIIDYQIPPLSGNCGKVDIVINKKNEKEIYLTEVKPYSNNAETLLRMISEILTHFQSLENNGDYIKYCEEQYLIEAPKLVPAIMFFEKTPQEEEYQNADERIKKIISAKKIKVFSCNEETKEIKLLN